MKGLCDLVEGAEDEFREELANWANEDVGDAIYEIADSWTPVYNTQCLQIAADNLSEIACRELDDGLVDPLTPARAAQIAIFDYLAEQLWCAYDTWTKGD